MKNIKDSIVGITIGVRFSKTFRIPDMSGEIIDSILNDERSPFDTKFFPRFNETSRKAKILFNEEGENLKITYDNIILSLKVNKNFDEKFKFLKEKVIDYFCYLFDSFDIENISRIGVVFFCDLDNPEKLNDSIGSITNSSIKNMQVFDLFFSEKKQTMEGLIKKGVKDYINIFYSLSKGKNEKDEDNLEFMYDFQKNFIPTVLKLKEAKLENHLEKAFEMFKDSYEKWLKDYDKQPE